LLFRSAGTAEAEILDDVSATASVIAHASQLGMEHVVGRQLAFVNVDAMVLLSDFVHFLPSDRVILEILETVEATPALIERLHELRQLGFKFALDDVVSDSVDVQQFLPLVDIIKIDIKGIPSGALPALAHKLKSTHTKLLAEKVETIEEFEHCMTLGFDYFQGYYFSRPVILTGRKIAPSELAILQVLNLINAGADNSAIEQSVKREPMLSLNLLRLVNTPAAGTLTTINSVAQALLVLGRRQLQRWLQILLYAKPGKTLELTSPLLQMAIIRGKLLELMALQMRPADRIGSDIGFTVGMLSLMDTLFSMPMA
jgi:EAL and modified HD-GYP domain-containing signal transduction protein